MVQKNFEPCPKKTGSNHVTTRVVEEPLGLKKELGFLGAADWWSSYFSVVVEGPLGFRLRQQTWFPEMGTPKSSLNEWESTCVEFIISTSDPEDDDGVAVSGGCCRTFWWYTVGHVMANTIVMSTKEVNIIIFEDLPKHDQWWGHLSPEEKGERYLPRQQSEHIGLWK